MLISGYYIYPCSSSPAEHPLIFIPLFVGLIVLGIGVLIKEKIGSVLKITGWVLFSFFWSLLPCFLYTSEGGDVFNAAVCIIGVYIFIYMAYQEWLSIQVHEYISCLNWIAGGTFIAGMIYFTIDSGIFPELKKGLITVVSSQSNSLLNILGINSIRQGPMIIYNQIPITIIFACTAIQAMVLFIGMIGALGKVNIKRKLFAIAITIIPMYFLNLVRNASVIFLVGGGFTSFHIAHNILSKAGALITLIALLFLTFKILPELYDEILNIFDLPKRRGPVEQIFSKILGKKKE
jgi:archaeosortase A (PGF-CTERM-specific)